MIHHKNTVLAGMLGNALEWYDFTVYAFYVPILAKLFFPNSNPFVSIIEAFSVFTLSFLIRPIGAIFFGYIGDHFGRCKALIISIILMTLPTFLIAFLPTYATLGVLAPLLLILLRIAQGLAVSGELTTTTSFLVEHAGSAHRGFAGSLAMCSAFIGIVLSSVVAFFLSHLLSIEALSSWGWRLSFLLGGIAGFIGLIIRLNSVDPKKYQDSQKKNDFAEPSIVSHLFTLKPSQVLFGMLLTAIMSVGNYYLIAFLNTYLVKNIGLPFSSVITINMLSLTLFLCLLPVAAFISDKVGRKPLLIFGIVGFILFAYPIFRLLSSHDIYEAFWGESLIALFLAPISGVIPTTLAELFETYNRNTGLSLSYNLSLALFGGTAPLVGIWLVTITKNVLAPAFYLMIISTLSLLIVLFFLKENYQKELG